MQRLILNQHHYAIRFLIFMSALGLLLVASCTNSGVSGPSPKPAPGGPAAVTDGSGNKRYLIDLSMKLSPQSAGSNLSIHSAISDISMAIICAQVPKTLFTLAKAQAEVFLPSLAAGCRMEIFAFSLSGAKYSRKIAFSKLDEGGSAYFESTGSPYGMSLRIARQLPNPLQEKSPFVLTLDEITKGSFGGAPTEDEDPSPAPPFSITVSSDLSNSTFRFLCLSSFEGIGESSTCEGMKIANLKWGIGLRPAENREVTVSQLDTILLGGKKVINSNPSYIAPVGSTSGGFSITIPHPIGSRFRRLLVVLADETHAPAIGRTHWSLRLFADSMFLSATDSAAASFLSGQAVSVEADGASLVFSSTSAHSVIATDLFEVDPASDYTISGYFKSKGALPSRLYFGFDSYDANLMQVKAIHVLRRGNAGTISSISDSTITTLETLSGWSSTPVPPATTPVIMAFNRSLGFYFDGDTSKIPDLLVRITGSGYNTDPTAGTYSTASAHTITLNGGPLPASISSRIVPGVTKVMNQYDGGNYLYTAAASAMVPSTWTYYEGHISGEAIGNLATKFRLSTRFVKLILLLNYQQDSSYTLVFDQLRLVKDSPI